MFYLFMAITILTGYFKDFLFIMTIILVHECGHILCATLFHWKIEEIKILPFGGLTMFHEDINSPLVEEFLILCMGPITQIILCTLLANHLNSVLFYRYHLMILWFNLLPIQPLDGSKFINLISNFFFPYLKSYQITNIISIISVSIISILLFQIPFNFIGYMVLFFLIIEVIKSFKREKFCFNRFLLERYQKEYYFSKWKQIRGGHLEKMYRGRKHLFWVENKWQREREILRKRFDLSRFL